MRKRSTLGTAGKLWLKGFHITLSVVWLGAAISMHVLRFVWTPTADGDLYAIDHTVVLLDHWVIVPSALGALATGFLGSWMTTWGFFRYRWVTVKWIVASATVLYGSIFLSQWEEQLAAISKVEGLMALQNPVYVHDQWLYALSGVAMILALSALPTISSLKPWMKRDKARFPQ